MKKLMHIMFLSCLKATELIEKKFHFRLSWTERMQLKAHKAMCSACSTYEKQSILIENGISKVNKNEFTEKDLEQLKKQIIGKIENSK